MTATLAAPELAVPEYPARTPIAVRGLLVVFDVGPQFPKSPGTKLFAALARQAGIDPKHVTVLQPSEFSATHRPAFTLAVRDHTRIVLAGARPWRFMFGECDFERHKGRIIRSERRRYVGIPNPEAIQRQSHEGALAAKVLTLTSLEALLS